MSRYTLSYGLLPAELTSDTTHLLPVTSIKKLASTVITTGRDGNVILEDSKTKLAVHSDWISGIACISPTRFITVSHDFTICYNWHNVIWNHRIIGYHDDYVKGVELIKIDEVKCKFATIGLDKKLKIWELDTFEVENEDDVEATLLAEFNNVTSHDTGSIYCLACTQDMLIFGDNVGRLRWCSCKDGSLIRSVDDAHLTNLKTLKVMDGGTTVMSTSSDGSVKLWDIACGTCLLETTLHHAIWSIEGDSSSNFYVGDSAGNILHYTDGVFNYVYDSKTDQGGILAMSIVNGELWFSTSGNSNMNKINLDTKELKVIEGGYALLRCSLLTNRRHVITENTRGDLEMWDIVSCELLKTFCRNEGTFDEIVRTVNPKEVLPHWCSVSIKRGILFVKVNERFLTTEVYGSALNGYELANVDKADDINFDERYNLGRIAINSLLNGFIDYELAKDKKFREEIVTSKKQTPPSTPVLLRRHNSIASENAGLEHHKDSKNNKEKRRLSIFTKFTQSNSTTPQSSAPNTPNGLADLPHTHQGIIEESEDELSLMLPGPATAPTATIKPPTLSRTVTDQSIERSATPSSTFGLHKPSRYKFDDSNDDTRSISSVGNPDIKFNFTSRSFSNTNTKGVDKQPMFLNEYIEEICQNYLKQVPSSSSSFMKFGKRVPETLFVRDSGRPIIKIKSGAILTINNWKEGSNGETIAYSTYLPQPTYTENDLIDNYHIYESLERHLPIWLGKILFKEDKVIRNYPKVTFIIQPWKDEQSGQHEEDSTQDHKRTSFYKKIKPYESPLMLPKINDSNVRLTAANMIKAKKIKHYIVERFESKTPEMKNKVDPSEWLEILCKGTVLDNDITLSAIRTLYWKSNADIVLEYRRKAID